MEFSIQPYEIKKTASSLKIEGFTPKEGGMFEVPYSFKDDQGNTLSTGIQMIPAEAMAAITLAQPNMAAVNAVLAGFGITAIQKID